MKDTDEPPDEIDAMWRRQYGATYREVVGRRFVKRFTYFGQVFCVGDVVVIYAGRNRASHVRVNAKIMSAGSMVRCPQGKAKTPRSRRAIIFKAVEPIDEKNKVYDIGEEHCAFLWSDDPQRMTHNVLESLAHAGEEEEDDHSPSP